jgi:hypothetical protein
MDSRFRNRLVIRNARYPVTIIRPPKTKALTPTKEFVCINEVGVIWTTKIIRVPTPIRIIENAYSNARESSI